MVSTSADNSRPILVTGGAGYIGSALTFHLLHHGYSVRVFDNLLFGGDSLLAARHHPRFELVPGDIRDETAVTAAVAGTGAVVHLAAVVGDPACRARPDLAKEVNGHGARVTCEAARQAGIRRFVFVSTCSNYGRMDADEGYVDEDSPLRPVSLYAELKVSVEQELLRLDDSQFEPVCLRFATAYGVSPRMRFDLTVNEFTRDLYLKKRLNVYGQQFWRPYCHVGDLALACRLALEADPPTVAYRAFNVGATGENYRKQDLLAAILTELPDRAEYITHVECDDDPRDYRVNCDRIRKTLGFAPQYTVPDGIREILDSLRCRLIAEPEHQRFVNYYE